MTSEREIKRRIEHLKRNLVRGRIAVEAEIEAVLAKHNERSEQHRDLFIWADLRVLAAVNQKGKGGRGGHTPDALAAAILALEEAAEFVWMPSLKRTLAVVPAGWNKINAIERCEWWLPRLEAGRLMLMNDKAEGRRSKADPVPCDACGRPLHPGNVDELIEAISVEIANFRAWIYAHVTSGSPAPAKERAPWANQITVLEHMALIQAWHRVNTDIVSRIPRPVSKDGQREQPTHWSWLFAHQADYQSKPPTEIMENQSLAALIAVISLEAITADRLKSKGRMDAKKTSKALRRR